MNETKIDHKIQKEDGTFLFKVEKIIRSADKKISHNFNTFGSSCTVSVTPSKEYLNEEEIAEISKVVRMQCEQAVDADIQAYMAAINPQK